MTLFTLLSHHLFLSILPFYFTSPPALSLWFYKRNWHPDSDKTVLGDPSPPSSQSAGFLNKVVFLASAPHLRFIGLLCGEQSKLGLSNSPTDFQTSKGDSPSQFQIPGLGCPVCSSNRSIPREDLQVHVIPLLFCVPSRSTGPKVIPSLPFLLTPCGSSLQSWMYKSLSPDCFQWALLHM